MPLHAVPAQHRPTHAELLGLRDESSDSARRAFCGRCGSTLFWQGNGRDYISIAAGTLDGATGLPSVCHIHVADKGDYYSIDDGLPQSADGNFAVPIP